MNKEVKRIPLKKVLINLVILYLGILFLGIPNIFAYNRQAAAEYADKWAQDRNLLEYTDFTGNDCANYVSQCLIAGRLDLSSATGEGIVTDNLCGEITISYCDTLHTYLLNNQYVEYSFTEDRNAEPPDNLTVGDIIIFGTESDPYNHVAIVAAFDNVPLDARENVLLDAHSSDRFHEKYSFFIYDDGNNNRSSFSRANFYHFPTSEEAGAPVRFHGTGDFYGPEALAITIYGAGHNFLGWILNNTDSTNQDMVVGEDTSELEGCTYYIRGWCTDAHKGIPDPEDVFTEPWTSDNPEHWAYWIRQAVIYGTESNYIDHDILDAVWYIADRSGSYNEILTSVGYPEDGPKKPTEDHESPAPPTSFTATAGDKEVTLSWVNPDDADFTGTIIRYRTDGTYPTGPTDGTLVTSKVSSPGSTDSFTHKGLTNGTVYYYTAFSYDEVSNYSEAISSAQDSATPEDISPPGDITDFTATAGDGQVSLSWTNPTDLDFVGVKVLRKIGSYPVDPTDGTVVYNGTDTNTTDIGLTNGTTYYYTAFSYDEVPNYSSGSQASATPQVPSDGGDGGGGGGCFVATAAFGTPMADQVKSLCRFRDQILLRSPTGKEFVRFYYTVSPPIADFIRNKPGLKAMVREVLKPLVEISKEVTE